MDNAQFYKHSILIIYYYDNIIFLSSNKFIVVSFEKEDFAFLIINIR